MKYFQSIKNIALASAVLFGMQACEKLDRTDSIGDGGQTVVKLVSGGMAGKITPGSAGHILTGVDFVSTPQSLDIVDVRRDVPNSTELNRTMNVVLQVDTFAMRIYNDSLIADGANPLEVMPEAWYSLNYTPSASGIVNLTFAPGELAKQITITINDATLMDPASTYGFAFSILSVDANGKISESRTMIYEIGAKNDYDGRYEITGTCVDANGLYQGDYGDPAFPRVYDLITVGGQTGLFYDVSWDYANYIVVNIATGGGANTAIRPRITFDSETGAVVDLINNNNGAILNIQPGSKFNAADHSIDLEWILGRWHVTEHWEYLGPR